MREWKSKSARAERDFKMFFLEFHSLKIKQHIPVSTAICSYSYNWQNVLYISSWNPWTLPMRRKMVNFTQKNRVETLTCPTSTDFVIQSIILKWRSMQKRDGCILLVVKMLGFFLSSLQLFNIYIRKGERLPLDVLPVSLITIINNNIRPPPLPAWAQRDAAPPASAGLDGPEMTALSLGRRFRDLLIGFWHQVFVWDVLLLSQTLKSPLINYTFHATLYQLLN